MEEVASYDSKEDDYRTKFKNLKSINITAIANVCQTDTKTVQLFLKEFIAQLVK